MKPKTVNSPPPEVRTEVKALSANLAEIDLVTEPKDAFDVAKAVGQRNQLKAMLKDLDAKRKAITGPLNEALKKVRELFKPVEDRMEGAVAAVTRGLEDYRAEAAKLLEEKRERLEARVEDGEITEEKAERIVAKAISNAGAGAIPTRKVRQVVVVDESLVPGEYRILDMVAIRRDALNGVKIPGVAVEEVDQVVMRS